METVDNMLHLNFRGLARNVRVLSFRASDLNKWLDEHPDAFIHSMAATGDGVYQVFYNPSSLNQEK